MVLSTSIGCTESFEGEGGEGGSTSIELFSFGGGSTSIFSSELVLTFVFELEEFMTLLSLGKLSELGSLVWDLWSGISGLGSLVWDLWSGISGLHVEFSSVAGRMI